MLVQAPTAPTPTHHKPPAPKKGTKPAANKPGTKPAANKKPAAHKPTQRPGTKKPTTGKKSAGRSDVDMEDFPDLFMPLAKMTYVH